MKAVAEKHLEEAAAFIAVAESGDAKVAAYEKAANAIIAARWADPELSLREVSRRLGRHERYAGRLVNWRESDSGQSHLPFASAEASQRSRERKEPTRHEDRVEMAGKLLADPEVVKATMPAVLAERSKSQRLIEQAVSRKNAEDRKRQVEAAQRRRDSDAAPLPAYMSRMVVKMNEWAAGLASIEPDLESLPPGRGREIVLDTLHELARQTDRCISRLAGERSELPSDDVIEGRAA